MAPAEKSDAHPKGGQASAAESLAGLRFIIDHSNDAYYILDSKGTIAYANRMAYELLGYDSKFLLGQAIGKIDRNFSNGSFRELFDRLLRDRVAPFDSEHVKHDGSILPVEMSAALMRLESVPFVFIAARDITERKNVENKLRALNESLEDRVAKRAAEAEKQTEVLRVLTSELNYAEQRERRRLAQLLHDHLQQYLVAAMLSVGTLSGRTQEEATRKALARIEEQLREAIEMTRTLSTELSPSVLQHGGLLEAVRWLARQMKEKHGLTVELCAHEHVTVEASDIRTLLFNAIQELLFNVIKHSGVLFARVEITSADDERIHITVSDQGRGFDPSLADRLPTGGFGLLALNQRICTLGGKFKVEAGRGKGTCISIIAPLQKEMRTGKGKSAAKSSSKSLPVVRGPIRVLIADDHELVREGIVELLRGEKDIEIVAEAPDGRAALQLAETQKPDVIIMDVSMPNLNGIEATRQLQEKWPHIRVVGLSSYEEEEMARAMLSAGASAFIAKGGPSTHLLAAVRGSSD